MGCCLVTSAPKAAALVHLECKLKSTIIRVAFGDITSEHVDAVVSISDSTLSSVGVAGAIKRNAGLEVAKECEAVLKGGPLAIAQVVVTSSGHMPCRRLIHVVGPTHTEESALADVKSAVHAALQRAEELRCVSVSLPGTCAAKALPCARIVVVAVMEWLRKSDSSLKEIRLVSWNSEAVKAWEDELKG